jgi:hypothetical protein
MSSNDPISVENGTVNNSSASTLIHQQLLHKAEIIVEENFD